MSTNHCGEVKEEKTGKGLGKRKVEEKRRNGKGVREERKKGRRN